MYIYEYMNPESVLYSSALDEENPAPTGGAKMKCESSRKGYTTSSRFGTRD